MKKVVTTERIPIKLWLDDIDEEALKQAENLANLPFAFHHIAVMPDAHVGYGMPIGGVLATSGAVIPNAVGVDIGCGMCALKTDVKHIDKGSLTKIVTGIRRRVPLGADHHKEKQDMSFLPPPDDIVTAGIVEEQFEAARTQVGTLGGGNHFIEIQKGPDSHIWIMVHSGSRNLGARVAEHYNRLAKKLNQQWHTEVPKEWQLAFLPLGSEEARNYMAEMNYCIDFAFANRKLITDFVKEAFADVLKHELKEEDFINIAHNYVRWENHFNTNVLVHRKGATSARKGERGIIPGSQGTKSYIVEGKGNRDSFTSCSHGAGRLLGRRQARNLLSLDAEKAKMDALGIIHSVHSRKDLDEAPGAYKDIDVVMQNQEDLAEIKVELMPLAVIKG